MWVEITVIFLVSIAIITVVSIFTYIIIDSIKDHEYWVLLVVGIGLAIIILYTLAAIEVEGII
jgi:hypothetical protein